MKIEIPVLVIFFNRPGHLAKMIARLVQLGVRNVYFACDGPRSDRTADECAVAETRSIAEHSISCFDECHFLYQDHNLGCGNGVVAAISWFFTKVDFGVILEDDCLPVKSFFDFVRECRDQHLDDKGVWHIGGCNPLSSRSESNAGYLTKFNHIWGWATWGKCWSEFPDYFKNRESWDVSVFDRVLPSRLVSFYRSRMQACMDQRVDTWDYQWFAFRLQRGMAIVSEANLIENIGFGGEATHTKSVHPLLSGMRCGTFLLPLSVKELGVDNYESEWEDFVWRLSQPLPILMRICRKLKKVFGLK